MSLVQQSPLAGAGLRGQRRPEEPALGLQQLPQPPQKRRVGRRQMPRQVLKIHIQPREALSQNRLQHLRRQTALRLVIRQDERGPPGVELSRLRQSGQVHHRPRPPGPGRFQHRLVVQGKQSALRRDAVSEGRQSGHIGQLLRQKPRLDEGIGVAVEHALSQLLVEIGDHQRLALRQRLAAAQLPVVPPQLPDRGSIARRDGGQGLPRRHGVDLSGEPHHQRLPHRQGQVRRQFVVRRQPLGGYAVARGDGVHGLPRAHHMDCH